MRIAVIGTGAMGVMLGWALRERGLTPVYVGRAGPVALRAKLDPPAAADGRAAASVTLDVPAPSDGDLATVSAALVAVKAFDLDTALAHVTRLPRGIPVVPLANGAVESVVRRAAESFSEHVWRLGFATIGITQLGDAHYAVKSRTGEVSFGPLLPADAPLTAAERALVEPAGVFCWHANILRLQRRKWLYNTVINTLCAARSLPRNGDLLADLSTLQGVFNEALALATAMWGALPMTRDELYNGMVQLIERTQDNENSMARDRRLGRRTESEWLAGLARDPVRYPLLAELHRIISGG